MFGRCVLSRRFALLCLKVGRFGGAVAMLCGLWRQPGRCRWAVRPTVHRALAGCPPLARQGCLRPCCGVQGRFWSFASCRRALLGRCALCRAGFGFCVFRAGLCFVWQACASGRFAVFCFVGQGECASVSVSVCASGPRAPLRASCPSLGLVPLLGLRAPLWPCASLSLSLSGSASLVSLSFLAFASLLG